MEGKMNKLQLLAITIVLSLAIAVNGADNGPSKDYIANQYVGKAERVILARFGKPTSTMTVAAKELGGELRRPVREQYFAHRPNTQVRELYYKTKNGETIFWLLEKKGMWLVITDIRIAPGVQF